MWRSGQQTYQSHKQSRHVIFSESIDYIMTKTNHQLEKLIIIYKWSKTQQLLEVASIAADKSRGYVEAQKRQLPPLFWGGCSSDKFPTDPQTDLWKRKIRLRRIKGRKREGAKKSEGRGGKRGDRMERTRRKKTGRVKKRKSRRWHFSNISSFIWSWLRPSTGLDRCCQLITQHKINASIYWLRMFLCSSRSFHGRNLSHIKQAL